jgi:hypothetical protein
VVTERGDAGVERVKAGTGGLGAQSVIEGVGTTESMLPAIGSARRVGRWACRGGPWVELSVDELCWSQVQRHGGPARCAGSCLS